MKQTMGVLAAEPTCKIVSGSVRDSVSRVRERVMGHDMGYPPLASAWAPEHPPPPHTHMQTFIHVTHPGTQY